MSKKDAQKTEETKEAKAAEETEEVEETAKAEEEEEKQEEKPIEQKLQELLDAAKEAHLRTAAEYANYRARSAKEKEQTYNNAKGAVVAEILPVIDNIERALSADSDYESLRKGVEMTLEGLASALQKLGVESFGEAGDSFDPTLHNAVMHIDDESLDENVITDVFQKGYKIGDKIIRPAMVKTAN